MVDEGRIRESLVAAGLSQPAIDAAVKAAIKEERGVRGTREAYAHACALRARGGPTYDEAVDLYRQVKDAGVFDVDDSHLRRGLLYFWLSVLLVPRWVPGHLPATSHRDNQSTGEDLPAGERKRSLAMAMHEATGIGESTIRNVYAEYARTREMERDGWQRTGLFWTKWLP